LWIDCDVLDADGGTRTACITGAFVAAVDAVAQSPFAERLADIFVDSVAAVSIGIIDKEVLLDLDYSEDARAAVDMNLVMTGSGKLIEVQGTGERTPFSFEELERMLAIGSRSIRELTTAQRQSLGSRWPIKQP
jgi:ribonuclease PH